MNQQPPQNPSVEQIRNLPGIFDPTSFAAQEGYGQKSEHSPRSNPRSVTASANVNPLDDEVRVDSTSASVTMTLETAVGCDGRRHLFKKTVAANSMIIACTGSETIDGSATVTRTAQYDVVAVISNGTTWDLEYAGPATAAAGTSGTYTPTLTNVANTAARTAYQCQYLQIGATVTVSGKVDIDPTAGGTLTRMRMSLPVASNIGATEDVAGVGTRLDSTVYESFVVLGDATNNEAEIRYTSATFDNATYYFTFTYQVI